MALNLGRPAYDAIQRLKNNPDWRTFVASLEEQISQLVHLAIESPPDNRVDNTGYVRGVRDVHSHILLAEQSQPTNRTPKAQIKPRADNQLNV